MSPFPSSRYTKTDTSVSSPGHTISGRQNDASRTRLKQRGGPCQRSCARPGQHCNPNQPFRNVPGIWCWNRCVMGWLVDDLRSSRNRTGRPLADLSAQICQLRAPASAGQRPPPQRGTPPLRTHKPRTSRQFHSQVSLGVARLRLRLWVDPCSSAPGPWRDIHPRRPCPEGRGPRAPGQ